MSAFQAYAGTYEYRGETFIWRCYATARVHDLRRSDHGPLPPAPQGCKWTTPTPAHSESDVSWLVDEAVIEFSQMLLQVVAQPAPTWSARSDAAPSGIVIPL